jgi:hypothetical protein
MTMHVILEGGAVVAEFAGWNPAAVAAMLHQRGANISPPSVAPTGRLVLGSLEALPATDAGASPPDGKITTGRAWTIGANSATASYTYGDPPPMTAEQARAALAITDGQFEPRWIEDIAAGNEMPARYTAWAERRATLRAIVNGG